MEAGRWCAKQKLPWIFDPAQQIIGLGKADLVAGIKTSSCVIANAYEWSLLSEKTGMSVKDVLKVNPLLIVTQGEDGVIIHSKKEGMIELPACKPDKVVNPTGAGDALRAGLLTGLSAGWPLKHCGMLGASLASFVVEQEGTLIDFLDVNDVWERAEVTYKETLPELP